MEKINTIKSMENLENFIKKSIKDNIGKEENIEDILCTGNNIKEKILDASFRLGIVYGYFEILLRLDNPNIYEKMMEKYQDEIDKNLEIQYLINDYLEEINFN